MRISDWSSDVCSADLCAEPKVGHAAKGARDVDSGVRARSGEADGRATSRDGKTPLAAQFLERIGKMLSAPMRRPDGSQQNRGPNDRAHCSSDLTLLITKRLFGIAGSLAISIRRSWFGTSYTMRVARNPHAAFLS